MPDILEDNNFTTATEHLPARRSAPIPTVNALYLLEQDMAQNEANYTPLALNTAHPTDASYKLVAEGPPTIEAGVRTWTRIYAQVPATWTDENEYPYNFIGWGGNYVVDGRFPGGIDPTTVQGRARRVITVPAQLTYEYFLVGIGGTYASHESIPVIQDTQYYYNVGGIFPSGRVNVDFIWDSAAFSNPSVPSLTQYFALVAVDAASANSFSLVVKPSRLTRWKGNIYQRETLRVKAQ